MKFIDLFAGIGGFHTGLEKAGHTCVGWVEWDSLLDRVTKLSMTQTDYIQQQTFKMLKELIYQMQTCGHSEALAQTFHLLDEKKDLKVSTAVCSLKLSDALKKEYKLKRSSLPFCSWKTLSTVIKQWRMGLCPGAH